MKIKTKATAAIVAAAALTFTPFAAQASATTAPCDSPEVLVSARAGRSIQISGSDISQASMWYLWQIVNREPGYATPLLGKVIAADQNWLGSCKYPGIGLGVGSGTNWATRNVAVWVWADEVDLNLARYSILVHIGEIEATTTTTSSTTTTTTLPPVTTSTTSTTTTTDAPAVTTTTEPVAIAAVVMPRAEAPVAAASVRVVKKVAKNKVCKTVKVKKKKKVVCK